jgi:MYXO-CTERM domain-containing protein
MTKPELAEGAVRASAGAYPALERDIFAWHEAVFFGNLFEPEHLTHFREVVLVKGHPELRRGAVVDGGAAADDDDDTVPHRNMYACFTLGLQEETLVDDKHGVAYLNHRMSAKPGSKIWPHPPKRCHFKDARKNEEMGDHCKWLPNEGMYESCQGDNGVSYAAILVSLHDPCSVIDDKELCDAMRLAVGSSGGSGPPPPASSGGSGPPPPASSGGSSPPPPASSGRRSCACSLDGAGSAPLPTSVAALLALVLAGRRARRRG